MGLQGTVLNIDATGCLVQDSTGTIEVVFPELGKRNAAVVIDLPLNSVVYVSGSLKATNGKLSIKAHKFFTLEDHPSRSEHWTLQVHELANTIYPEIAKERAAVAAAQ